MAGVILRKQSLWMSEIVMRELKNNKDNEVVWQQAAANESDIFTKNIDSAICCEPNKKWSIVWTIVEN